RLQPHPVSAFGSVMASLERRLWRDDHLAGALHAAAGSSLGLVAGLAVRGVLGPGLPSTLAATYLSVAGRGLAEAATSVVAALEADDLDEARALLPALVGRDPAALDEKEITRAVVESVAENTVDAVVAPLLWAAVAGAPGALGHRAVNTVDAMVGQRSIRYLRYGWAGARLDDAAAWVPARVTAVAVAAVRPHTAGAVWQAVREDAPRHPSPNAGVAEAAFAAALGLRLGGENRYGHRIETRPPRRDTSLPGSSTGDRGAGRDAPGRRTTRAAHQRRLRGHRARRRGGADGVGRRAGLQPLPTPPGEPRSERATVSLQPSQPDRRPGRAGRPRRGVGRGVLPAGHRPLDPRRRRSRIGRRRLPHQGAGLPRLAARLRPGARPGPGRPAGAPPAELVGQRARCGSASGPPYARRSPGVGEVHRRAASPARRPPGATRSTPPTRGGQLRAGGRGHRAAFAPGAERCGRARLHELRTARPRARRRARRRWAAPPGR